MKLNVEMTAEEFNDYQEYLKNGKKCLSFDEFLNMKGFKKIDETKSKSFENKYIVINKTIFKNDEDTTITIEEPEKVFYYL